MEQIDQIIQILERLTEIQDIAQQRLELLEKLDATGVSVNNFHRGESGIPPVTVRAADGALFRILQMLHASVQAGWWETSDGKRAKFSQVAEQVLAPMGLKKGNIRVYLTKAYDQKNWSQFIVELEREASRYQRKRKLGQVVRSLTVRKKGHPSSDRWLFFRYKCL